jgi:L-fuconolactonase
MLIVDAQVHIWGADAPERPWPEGRSAPHRPQPFSEEDLRVEMDRAGVRRVVLVPPSWEGERNDLALAAARLHPDRFAVMGRPPLAPRSLDDWRDERGMLGIRVSANTREARAWFKDPSAWLWNEADRARLPVTVSAAGLLPQLDRIAQFHPDLKLCVDHLGLLRAKDNAAFDDLPRLLRLARLPNVAVKASALPAYSSHDYPYYNLHPYLRRVFDAFGPRRMFWGSDLTRLECGYRQAVTLFTEELPFLTPADLEWVMGRGVVEWFGWPIGAEPPAATGE